MKRLLVCTLHCTPPVAAGLVFLVSEVCKSRLSLRQELIGAVEVLPEEPPKGSTGGYAQLGNFDASKRDPLYACSATPTAWELSMMRLHFHPSVRAFACSFLNAEEGHAISYKGDPTVDFSLSSFLNRFSYKNPKKSQVDIRRRRSQAHVEDPMNILASAGKEGDVAPDKVFFYKFFGDRNRLRAEGKSRNRSRHKKSEDNEDGDDSDLGSDLGEDAIDRFADKLADDLMENNDDEDDLGDFDEQDDDEDDDVYDDMNDTGDFDEDAEEDDDADGDSGLQQWDGNSDDNSNEDDEDAAGGGNFDMTGGEDSDDSALDFEEFLEKQKSKGKGKTSGKKTKYELKKRKAVSSESVFATADSYEDEMEAAVASHRMNDGSKQSSNDGHNGEKKKRKKARKL